MFSDENARVISLDTESRVKGICQLMDGVVLTIRISEVESSSESPRIIRQFEEALSSLNKYALQADLLLDKHRNLKKINEGELERYQKTIRMKMEEITEILKDDYEALGLSEFADFCGIVKLSN